eukprot:g987.t1
MSTVDIPADLKTFTEEMISKGFLMAEGSKFTDYNTKDCLFIRPTGNPMPEAVWNGMRDNKDVVVEESKLLSINKAIKCSEDSYLLCMTAHGKFSYKGTKNDDIYVMSCLMQRQADKSWKCSHAHRSTGRKPDEDLPKFD